MPGGPPILWADTDARSAPSPPTSMRRWPAAATASAWLGTPSRRQSSTTSVTGWTVPTSWLAHWQCTSDGGRPCSDRHRSIASPTASVWILPTLSTATPTTGAARAEESRTAECSTDEQTTGPPPPVVAPQTAALTASVPPEVKTICRGRTPRKSASCSRAPSNAARAMRPSVWTRPGSAVTPRSSHAAIAALASGRSGVVEA